MWDPQYMNNNFFLIIFFFRNDESAVLAAIEGRGDSKKQTSRTLAKLAQQLDEDL